MKHILIQSSLSKWKRSNNSCYTYEKTDKDVYLMNNPTIRLEITIPEVEYKKIMHINPDLAELDMESYNSLPSVQKILVEMTRLDRLVTTQVKQASYIATAPVQKKEQEQIREQQQQEKTQEMKKEHKQAIERE
mmetsp:Transcript_53073/g.61291  ORF Transcript_53073/g.61291 Transcript_53073/m.61291 type:complete len:134 (+) Transcript_53073:319-720(+)|eukprot:CAMPEP_0170781624 /NCGR_PEP_ID=MMETSP0733-20121128/14327_1 /TAXON_ID=186038 /ORGANISM="Fragilariopsis kerguelensis, Strain L26-C5" /LENGTH=133 /DNA_ID=CAMNT_0011125733 /DNA_START=300 /DNA_END=701 /DNA_ORIENTATION=-